MSNSYNYPQNNEYTYNGQTSKSASYLPKYYNENVEPIYPVLNDQTSLEIRMPFIQKVYFLLILQIIYTTGIVSVCYFVDQVYNFLMENPWIFYSSLIVYFVLFIVLICIDKVARTKPWNYILLFVFTTAVSIILGTSIPGNYDGKLVFICLGITLFVTICASFYACQTKRDFTTKGGILFAFFVALLVFIVLQFFFRSQMLGLIISVIGAFLMTAYIIFDTQLIIGGKHRRYQLYTDEHVFGALILYVDILNLFLFMLGINRNS